MNLYTKVVYGSIGYTRTFQLILKQSPLIEVFRRVHTMMRDNFHLLHRTVRHAPPNLQNTLRQLRDMLEKDAAHEIHVGRTAYKLEDHFREGMRLLQTAKTMVMTALGQEGLLGDESDENAMVELEMEDLEVIE